MDAVAFEAVIAAGCAAAAIAARRRPRGSAAQPKTAGPSLRRSIADLPRRHRRAARAIADLADACLARHPQGSFEAYTAAETLRTYLPETIAAFLAVPRGYRRERQAGQPAPDDEIRRQFAILAAGLARIAEADAAAGASRLNANGVFLTERFGPAPAPPRRATLQTLRRDLAELLTARFIDRD